MKNGMNPGLFANFKEDDIMLSKGSVTAILLVALSLCTTAWAQKPDVKLSEDELENARQELGDVAKSRPECLVDDNGLPKLMIITRNGTGLFDKPRGGGR